MNTFIARLRTFWNEEAGLTTVEYAIAGGLVGLAVVLAFTNLGTRVGEIITAIHDALPAP